VDENEVMVEWWLIVKTEEYLRKTCCSAVSLAMYLMKRASTRLNCGTAS
jgi:hypothetical protein